MMNNQKELWERLAKKNPRYYIHTDLGRGITEEQFRESGERVYKNLIAADNLTRGKENILDFGCGVGRLTEFMAKDFKKVIGVDISSTMLAQARQRLKSLKNAEFLEIDGQSIPLPDDSIDFVFSYLVFQHIKERKMVRGAFKSIYRVLKPGGIFKVLLRSDKAKDMNRWWSGVGYDEAAIKKVYEKIGFKMLKIEYVDKFAYWLWLQKIETINDPRQDKWERGKNNTLRFYRAKLPWKARQFNRKLYLPGYFGPMIGKKKELKIADIGAGMFCTIGSLWKTAKVKVYPSDALADEFNQMLKDRSIIPLIPIGKQNMENLTYPDGFFDIVHCVNALDHTIDPIKAIKEMYRVCKPGGYIYLRHFVNVGENEEYSGLHIWNIDINDNKDCVIWNREKKILLSHCFDGFKTVQRKELDIEPDSMIISVLHKKPMLKDLIVIATHNNKKVLTDMLAGINPAHDFLIVDTSSETDYVTSLANEFPHLKLRVTRTPYKGYAWGAYMWAYHNFPAKNYLFLHDSLIITKQDYLERFKAVQPKLGIAAWAHFRFRYGPDTQRQWVNKILGISGRDNDPEYGVFGPIFYCNRQTLDGLKEKGLLFPYPTDKNLACATERAVSVIIKMAGYENRQVVNQYIDGKIAADNYDGFFKKVFVRRP